MKDKFIDVIKDYFDNQKSLIAFNVQNIYHLQILNEVTDELKLPVIAQFSARFLKHFDQRFGIEFIAENFRNDYIYFHLDHCKDMALIQHCIDKKFDGVMYDGSADPIEDNTINTIKVMKSASDKGCLVEGELGEIGGVEDGEGTENNSYADLSQVKKFVQETGVHLLALGIGNAHGFYTTLKSINTSILKKAQDLLNNTQPLVLHGGSGLSEQILHETVQSGVVKINYSTQIKQLSNEALANYLVTKELFNEIQFENQLRKSLKPFLVDLITKYSK